MAVFNAVLRHAYHTWRVCQGLSLLQGEALCPEQGGHRDEGPLQGTVGVNGRVIECHTGLSTSFYQSISLNCSLRLR
jgi:hypothetical protein